MSISNFVRVGLPHAITNTATSIIFTDAASPFNNPPSKGTLVLTDNEWNPTAFEVITYTGLTDNANGTHTLTGVTRGAESTTAAAWDAEAIITQPMTAQTAMLTDGGNAASIVSFAGSMSVGTATPSGTLHVDGSSKFSNGSGFQDMQLHREHTNPGLDLPIGRIKFSSRMGGLESEGASIHAYASQAWTSTTRDTGISIKASVGSSVPQECARFVNGRVGVGGVEPTSPLTVNGDAEFHRDGVAGQFAKLSSDISAHWVTFQSLSGSTKPVTFNQINTASTSHYAFQFDGTTGLVLEKGGRVAINAAEAKSTLTVNGGSVGIRGWDGGYDPNPSLELGYYAPALRTLVRNRNSTDGYGDMAFGHNSTSASVQLFLKKTGEVGIGTDTPAHKLHVAGEALVRSPGSTIRCRGVATGNAAVTFMAFEQNDGARLGYVGFGSGSNTNLYIEGDGGKAVTLNAVSTGNVGIGTSAPLHKLHVAGNIYATGNITSASDIRFKSKIERIADPVGKIKRLQGFTYQIKYDEDEVRRVGVSAQEVRKVLPEAVVEDSEGRLSVAYGNMVALLVEGMKDQQKVIDTLQGTVEALQMRVDTLESAK